MSPSEAAPSPEGIDALAGRTVLVTGAGRRVGRAIALAMGEAGAHVAVHYNTSADPANEVCELLSEHGVEAKAFQADLSDPDVGTDLVDRVWGWAGGVDVLVNNASIFPPGRLSDLSRHDLARNVDVNAWAPFDLTRALFQRASVAGRAGSVVNLLDSRLVGGDPRHSGYYLSKVLIGELTRMCAIEFAPTLTVNGVAPGPILSPEGKDAEYLRQRLDALPLRRWGGPTQVAEAVRYLATAPFVTGQIVFVDGGQHLDPWGSQ